MNTCCFSRGDFVLYEETIWGIPIRTESKACVVVDNPRNPYTGCYCKKSAKYAVVKIRQKKGPDFLADTRDLAKIKRLEDFSRDDLAEFRNEVVLNSLYVADYRNSFGISSESACDFFEGYMEHITEKASEDGYLWDYADPGSAYYDGKHTFDEFLKKYDNTDNLLDWWYCFTDFSWVEYGENKT